MIPTADWTSCLSGTDVATLSCIPIVLQNIINFLVIFSAVVCVFILIFAGFKFTTSEGDPEKIANARKTALYGLGGFVIVLASFFLLNLISKFTGVSQLGPQ